MGFTYDKIRRSAYLLATDAPPLRARYQALPFPEHWQDTLLALYRAGRPADTDSYRTVPTWRMDMLLQSLAPDLVVLGRPTERDGKENGHWLHVPMGVRHPLPDSVLQRLLTPWVRSLSSEPEQRAQVMATLAELRAEPPRWEEMEVDLLGCGRTDGGTAAPAARQFQLATDHLARRIMALDPYDTGADRLRFRAVPRGPRQQGAELISQPLPYEDGGRVWWYSVRMNVTLHTVPFSPEPRLHIHLGLRRWATHPVANGRLRLPYGHSTTVYLRPDVPWLPGAPASARYAVAGLSWNRAMQAHDWRHLDAAGILRGLALGRPFPDVAELLTAPEKWIGDGPGVRAAVVHSNHMGAHGVAAGLMSHQRSQIIEWAEQALPEGLVRAPDLRRSKISSNNPGNVRPKPQGADKPVEEARAADARRTALTVAARAMVTDDTALDGGASVVDVRLLWQTAAMRDTAITAFIKALNLPDDGGRPGSDVFDEARPGSAALLQWSMPDLNVRLRCLPLIGGLAGPLGVSPHGRSRRESLHRAISERRTAVASFLAEDGADPDVPTLALVEIDRPADFPSPLDDPKFAIRLGCADTGVLTQFALAPKKAKGYNSESNADHRAYSGWLDGLRQMGVRVLPEHTLDRRAPEGLRYAALWMVKRRADGPTRLPAHVPVAVLVTPVASGSGQAVITGWDDDLRTWIPYPKLLLRLTRQAEILVGDSNSDSSDSAPAADAAISKDPQVGRGSPYALQRRNAEEQRQMTERVLQRMIRSLRGRPTLLLTHAQNSRGHWTWLQDGKVIPDLLRTGHAPAGRLDPDLRLVRVRGTIGRETPQWWGIERPSGVNGLPSSLWTDSDDARTPLGRVFYSTTEKAGTFKASAVEADKLAPRPLRQGKRKGESTLDTGVPAWNPALMEIAVLGCHEHDLDNGEGDDPEGLALVVHQLRQAPDYLDALALPLPLHLARLTEEYVLPTLAEPESASDDPVGDETAYVRQLDDLTDRHSDALDEHELDQEISGAKG
ncbi:pPIWI_RE module domain-containing protein [Sphaerisporangium aureirubrum]|uniref:PPIWI_RE module domain-containing protein n=1 Tax=Sphaerisporangium aureirubrum TaxID=1544736 RepID=A0ABW1NK38_9ACTN